MDLLEYQRSKSKPPRPTDKNGSFNYSLGGSNEARGPDRRRFEPVRVQKLKMKPLLGHILQISVINVLMLVAWHTLVDCSLDHQSHHPEDNQISNERTNETLESQHAIEKKSLLTSSALSAKEQASKHSFKIADIRTLRNKCLVAERELDRCAAQLIGLGKSSGAQYPSSMQELNSVFCPKFRETVSCIKNHTECYKPFERQVINWILASSKRMNYKRCKNENEKVRFLKLTNSCLAPMRSPMGDCMGRYIGSLDAIANYDRALERVSSDDIQIQLACCANRRFNNCMMNSAKQMCKPNDTLTKLRRTNSNSSQRAARKQLLRFALDTMDDLKSTLDEMALTGPEFICDNVNENFCKTRFDNRYTNRLSRHESIVPAMIKIYANN